MSIGSISSLHRVGVLTPDLILTNADDLLMTSIFNFLFRAAQYGRAIGIGAAFAAVVIAMLYGVVSAFPVAFVGCLCMFSSSILIWVTRLLRSFQN